MDSVKGPILVAVGLVLFAFGAILLAKGGGSLASTRNKDGNDDVNVKGWKGLGSNWAGAALLLGVGAGSTASGAFGNFGQFANWAQSVWNYILGG